MAILILLLFFFPLVYYYKENPCGNGHFTCNNSQCIKKEWWCDGSRDCGDNSDEAFCRHINNYYTDCQSDQFDCKSPRYGRKRCIPIEWTCDARLDCNDGSDENLDRCITKRNCTADEFKCKNGRCIPFIDVCNGVYNCADKSDENCWRDISQWSVSSNMKNKFAEFLSSQFSSPLLHRDPHRYAISLFFIDPEHQAPSSPDSEYRKILLREGLYFHITMTLYWNQSEQIDATDLALYIHSQLALCSNPRNFFGTDLVSLLERKVEKAAPGSYSPLVPLSLCNSGVELSPKHLDNIAYFLSSNSTDSFITDMKALALLATRCLQKTNNTLPTALNISSNLSYLKSLQLADGSFRNLRSTAIIVQALMASEDKGIGWDLEKAVNFINTQQLASGSFDPELMSSYLVAPILSGQTFLNLYSQECISFWAIDDERKKKLEQMSRHKSFVTCSLWMGSSKFVINSLRLRVPSNSTFYDFMLLASAVDPCFEIKYVRPNGSQIYSICEISNSMETLEYWQLFQEHNGTITALNEDFSKISVKDMDKYVFWLTQPVTLPQE